MNWTGKTSIGVAAIGLAATLAVPAMAVPSSSSLGRSGVGNGQGMHGRTSGRAVASPTTSAQGCHSDDGGDFESGRRQRMRGGAGGVGWQQTPSGVLTASQRQQLAAMATEEKLARDVYLALGERFPSVRQFAQIARAEEQHLTSMRELLARYGIADPTAGLAAGVFADAPSNSLYRALLTEATTEQAALDVGVRVEKADIADLERALDGLDAPDVELAYEHLLAGSQRHLNAFGA